MRTSAPLSARWLLHCTRRLHCRLGVQPTIIILDSPTYLLTYLLTLSLSLSLSHTHSTLFAISLYRHNIEVTAAPFEVTEYGWGEFECAIRVFWQDPAEQPIDLHHLLKLYHTEGPASKKPVMSEKYDEVVFTSPDPHFLRLLRSYGVPGLGAAAGSSGSSSFSDYCTDFSDAADLQRLTEVQGSLKAQIEGSYVY